MTKVITDKEVAGFIPKRIFMQRKGNIAVVKCMYVFPGDVPDEFVEACNDIR